MVEVKKNKIPFCLKGVKRVINAYMYIHTLIDLMLFHSKKMKNGILYFHKGYDQEQHKYGVISKLLLLFCAYM